MELVTKTVTTYAKSNQGGQLFSFTPGLNRLLAGWRKSRSRQKRYCREYEHLHACQGFPVHIWKRHSALLSLAREKQQVND